MSRNASMHLACSRTCGGKEALCLNHVRSASFVFFLYRFVFFSFNLVQEYRFCSPMRDYTVRYA